MTPHGNNPPDQSPALKPDAEKALATTRRRRRNRGDPAVQPGEPHEITNRSRDIPGAVQNMLWGRSAGRCEFAGCNTPLWRSLVTQEPVNASQKAHIWSFSDGGSRGHAGYAGDIHGFENLMLVCYTCHRKLDQRIDGGRYTAETLGAFKRAHEERVELVTGIAPSLASHVLLYGANIGSHSSPLSFHPAATAMFPLRYPAEDRPIALGLANSVLKEDVAAYWGVELKNLQGLYAARVRERVADGAIKHMSVFALAPQPLLIALGCLLIDIIPADVYQLRREPPRWGFDADRPSAPEFSVQRPEAESGPPALVFALSASVERPRIEQVLGAEAAIWRVTVPHPNNDLINTRGQLVALRSCIRLTLDQIKKAHGQNTVLHVFPAMSVSAAVELGRVRMPKADMPWRVYDQIPNRGFVPAIDIRGGEISAVGGGNGG